MKMSLNIVMLFLGFVTVGIEAQGACPKKKGGFNFFVPVQVSDKTESVRWMNLFDFEEADKKGMLSEISGNKLYSLDCHLAKGVGRYIFQVKTKDGFNYYDVDVNRDTSVIDLKVKEEKFIEDKANTVTKYLNTATVGKCPTTKQGRRGFYLPIQTTPANALVRELNLSEFEEAAKSGNLSDPTLGRATYLRNCHHSHAGIYIFQVNWGDGKLYYFDTAIYRQTSKVLLNGKTKKQLRKVVPLP